MSRSRKAQKAKTRQPAPRGVVYLLHFDAPYQHARHYCGWTSNLSARLAAHAEGAGARLLQVVSSAGIAWTLARTWDGVTRGRERQIKNQGGLSRCCPLCGVRPRLQTGEGTIGEAAGGHAGRSDAYPTGGH